MIFCLGITFSLASAAEHEQNEKLPGIESPFSNVVLGLAKNWPPSDYLTFLREDEANGMSVRCYKTPDNPFYIGAKQAMTISAPITTVDQIITHFEENLDIYDGLEAAKITQKSENLWTVFSEQYIPFPFVPNEKTEIYYLINHSIDPISKKKTFIFRYQLKSSNHLKFNDGLIVLEELDANSTRYFEYDFFDADWGLAKTFAPSRIWEDSIQGLVQSSFAVKLKAELPEQKNQLIKKQSKALAEKLGLTKFINNAGAFK